MRIAFIFSALLSCVSLNAQLKKAKPRVIVLTDISSLSQKEGEPDDGQSLVRLLLYSNEIDLEGLIASSNLGHAQAVKPSLIRQAVEAYGKVQPNLLLHDSSYPAASALLHLIHPGQPIAGPKVPYQQSIGDGKDTDGSEWIIKTVDKKDSRPIWILIWGGSTELAQALWKIQKTRTVEGLNQFVSKIRVHSVGHQDATGPWIVKEFPELLYVLHELSIRGMYRGGDTTLTNSEWVKTNIWNHGALGDLYVDYDGGDIWSYKLGKVKGIKEGDTPSFLGTINNGLDDLSHPEWGGWGGRFDKMVGNNSQWVDAVDSVGGYLTDPDNRMSAVYRWRNAWQADFASRLDWCIKPYNQANHAPEGRLDPVTVNVISGGKVNLQLNDIIDPDRNKLSCRWYFYPEAGTYTGKLPSLNNRGSATSFTAPITTAKMTLHLIAEVSDDGKPSLIRYKRFIISINPKK